jgi:hypothetical protein
MMRSLTFIALCAIGVTVAEEAKPKAKLDASCPMHEQHMKSAKAVSAKDKRFAEMNGRAEKAAGMSFSQTETTHRFIRDDRGGYIEVTANDSKDTKLVAAVRKHLQNIAASFTAKDFSIPRFVHGEHPAGTVDMIRLADRISYKYEDIPHGAQVAIRTGDKGALAAVHAFLGYQLTEHRTSDGTEHSEHSHE